MTAWGYARVSKSDGRQSLDLQIDALTGPNSGIDPAHIWKEYASGAKDDRPELASAIKAAQKGDSLTVWRLDRLGRSLRHLIETVEALHAKGVEFRILNGQNYDPSANGKLMFKMFGLMAEFERELLVERINAGLKASRRRGIIGGSVPKFTKAQLRTAQAGMRSRDVDIKALAAEMGTTRQTLYRYLTPTGELRATGRRIMGLPPEPVKTEQTEKGA